MYIALPRASSSTGVCCSIRTRRRLLSGPEVLDDVGEQVVTVLPAEAEHRRPERQQPLRVAGGVLVA